MIDEQRLKLATALDNAAKTIRELEILNACLSVQLENAIAWIEAYQALEKAKT